MPTDTRPALSEARAPQMMRLHDIKYGAGKLEYRSRHATEPEDVLQTYLDEAARLVAEIEAAPPEVALSPGEAMSDSFARLRWFPLPGEAQCELSGMCGVGKYHEVRTA